MTAKTTNRRSAAAEMRADALVPFTDAQGRPCYRVKPTIGKPDGIILKDHYDMLRRNKITREWKWNDDGEKDAQGDPVRAYLKTKAKVPGRRGPKNKDETRSVHRLVVMCVMRANGGQFPKRGYEVSFINLDHRHDLRPENLKVRPRGENKHWVSAVLAFDPAFDALTGFDQPDDTLSKTD